MSKDETFLAGKLLLAMPQISDNRFDRSVIFLCAHDDQGAMGLQINTIQENIDFTGLLKQLGIVGEEDQIDLDLPVYQGGPVDKGRGFLLHPVTFKREDSIIIDNTYGVTGTVDALKQIADEGAEDDMLFILGYAGWTAGQLEQELQENTWLTAPATEELIFHTPPEQRWEKAIRSIGVDPSFLSAEVGHA